MHLNYIARNVFGNYYDEVKEKAKEFSKYIYIQTILLISQNVKPEDYIGNEFTALMRKS